MICTSRVKCFSFIASARYLVILLIAMSLSLEGTPGWTDEPAFDLAANERDHRPVCIMDADGGNLRAVIDMGKGRYAGSPRVSPKLQHVAFDVWTPATDSTASSAKTYVVGIDGSDLVEIGTGSMPTWVPDGRKITFFRFGGSFGLWVVDRTGEGLERLNNNGNSPRWSPDGKRVAFIRLRDGGVTILDPRTGAETVVASNRGRLDYRHGLDWSPDGKRLCVQCADPVKQTPEIRLIDVETGMITIRLAQPTGHYLSWSPVAAKILFFMKGPKDDFNQLYVLNPDSQDPPERVAGQPVDRDNTDASWSPDGKQIVFTSGKP